MTYGCKKDVSVPQMFLFLSVKYLWASTFSPAPSTLVPFEFQLFMQNQRPLYNYNLFHKIVSAAPRARNIKLRRNIFPPYPTQPEHQIPSQFSVQILAFPVSALNQAKVLDTWQVKTTPMFHHMLLLNLHISLWDSNKTTDPCEFVGLTLTA